MEITKAKKLKGEISVPGDKSISHRSIMFGALAKGITEIDGFLDGEDCNSTIDCFRSMGVKIEKNENRIKVYGNGLYGLQAPTSPLNCGNSGTTTRLISGILSGQRFESKLIGDDSLQSRPMKRVIDPLTKMGADISSEKGNNCVPLLIRPSANGLRGIAYESPVASAQVKSAILLAGLYAKGITSVTEPAVSRNHTELMLSAFGADITCAKKTSTIIPGNELMGQKIIVPGDISSAAYFIAAGLLVPNSELLIRNVNINPTRAGILDVCDMMGANISYEDIRTVSGEKVCDLVVSSSILTGCTIEGNLIPTLIDEIPVIAVMAACAEGETIIKDAAELKVKESDRIQTVVSNLSAMGCDITATDDGMIIRGRNNRLGSSVLYGTEIKTYLDHRIAMAFTIAGLIAEGATALDHPECVSISYPNFYNTLTSLQ